MHKQCLVEGVQFACARWFVGKVLAHMKSEKRREIEKERKGEMERERERKAYDDSKIKREELLHKKSVKGEKVL